MRFLLVLVFGLKGFGRATSDGHRGLRVAKQLRSDEASSLAPIFPNHQNPLITVSGVLRCSTDLGSTLLTDVCALGSLN